MWGEKNKLKKAHKGKITNYKRKNENNIKRSKTNTKMVVMKGWGLRRILENSGWWAWWNHGDMRQV
jgi:hypothetical protein